MLVRESVDGSGLLVDCDVEVEDAVFKGTDVARAGGLRLSPHIGDESRWQLIARPALCENIICMQCRTSMGYQFPPSIYQNLRIILALTLHR